MGQGGHPHGHPFALLGFGRAGGGEADPDHLVDGSEQAKLRKTLEVSAGKNRKKNGILAKPELQLVLTLTALI